MAALYLLNEVQIPQHDMQALYGFKFPLRGLYLSIKPILNSVESDYPLFLWNGSSFTPLITHFLTQYPLLNPSRPGSIATFSVTHFLTHTPPQLIPHHHETCLPPP